MSKIYNKNYYDKLQLTKEAQVLKPLLLNIKIEEKKIPEFIMEGKISLNFDFKRPFILCSTNQVYKTVSIYGIVNNFDRTVKYQFIDLSNLLDIWYQSSTIIPKDSLLFTDILIVRGRDDEWQIENKKLALIELVEIRKMKNKPTWLFIEGLTLESFKELYPGVDKAFGQTKQIRL